MPGQGSRSLYLSAATAAVTNRLVTSTNMKVGAYTVANSGAMPTAGARQITLTHTSGATTDTLGTVIVSGTDINGQNISETLTPVADDVVTGSEWFVTVTSITGAGWAIDEAEGTNDTLIVGCAAPAGVRSESGELRRVVIGETAAGAITLADSNGTLAVLKASIGEGVYDFDLHFDDYLSATLAAASKVTVTTT